MLYCILIYVLFHLYVVFTCLLNFKMYTQHRLINSKIAILSIGCRLACRPHAFLSNFGPLLAGSRLELNKAATSFIDHPKTRRLQRSGTGNRHPGPGALGCFSIDNLKSKESTGRISTKGEQATRVVATPRRGRD